MCGLSVKYCSFACRRGHSSKWGKGKARMMIVRQGKTGALAIRSTGLNEVRKTCFEGS
jgi:hypothetical protein